MSVITAEEFQAKVETIFERDRPGPFAVVRVYGINLGRMTPEIQEYADKFSYTHPACTIGWFGPANDMCCIAYVKETFTEMFDGGVGCLESMILADSEVKGPYQFDNMLMDYVEAMGFHEYSRFDVEWFVAVTTFG